jgi:thioredoxin reductase
MEDVIIVGGGIAGLSAALILGRCRRRVLIFDTGRPRNFASRGVHGFLSRDGVDPMELRRLGRQQLTPYTTVRWQEQEVVAAAARENCFEVTAADGGTFCGRILLLATGVVDCLPAVEGMARFYGRGVYHCPYCDGWEMRDRPLAVYGRGEEGVELALELKEWSHDLVLCTDGEELPTDLQRRLQRHGIGLRSEHLLKLEGGEELEKLVFVSGEELARAGLFFLSEIVQHSPLPAMLGCQVDGQGVISTGSLQQTPIPGLFLAGDAARSVKLAIVAAAEGAEAAFAINRALRQADRQ